MGNKIEVVDGVKGEWRSVTKAEDVKAGQRVRFAKQQEVADENR